MPIDAGGFQVTPPHLEGAAGELKRAGAGIESVSSQLSGVAGGGTELTGQPSAAAAFDDMVSTWTKELAGLGGFVSSTGNGASTAATNYIVTDYGVSEMFGGTP
jgi:hypothetical protein